MKSVQSCWYFFLGCDQFLRFFWAPSMKMIIFVIEFVQCWWYFFFWFWSPLNEDDHFWHALRSMMMILFFWVLKQPQSRWSFLACILLNDGDTFFWFLSHLNEDDHFGHALSSMMMILFLGVLKQPQSRWSFLACILLNDGDTFFWVSKAPQWKWLFLTWNLPKAMIYLGFCQRFLWFFVFFWKFSKAFNFVGV